MYDVPQASPAPAWGRAEAQRLPLRAPGGAPSRRLLLTIGLWLATAVSVGGFVLTDAPEVRQWWFALSSLLSVTVFSIGVAAARGVFRRDWTYMLVAVYIWAVGQVLRVADVSGQWADASWVAIAVLGLAASVLMAVGTTRLAQRDGIVPYATVRIDSAIYVIATGLGWWIASLREMSWAPQLITAQTISANLAPVGDAVILVGASALASSRTAHALASRALVLFAVTGLVADVAFAHIALRHHDILGSRVPALWMVQFALAATAALGSTREHTAPRSRMSLLSSVLVMTAAAAPSLIALYCAVEVGTSTARVHADAASAPVPIHLRTVVIVIVGKIVLASLVMLRSRRLVLQIEGLAERMELVARTDALTQVANRRAGERILGNAVQAAAVGSSVDQPTPGRALHVAFLDLDHFKAFNDTNGHQAGDRLLTAAAGAWSRVLGDRGTLFRYGGEEFAVILPKTSLSEACEIVDEMRRVTPERQTFSSGLATCRPGDDAEGLLGRADAALYEAKRAGRARTLVAS